VRESGNLHPHYFWLYDELQANYVGIFELRTSGHLSLIDWRRRNKNEIAIIGKQSRQLSSAAICIWNRLRTSHVQLANVSVSWAELSKSAQSSVCGQLTCQAEENGGNDAQKWFNNELVGDNGCSCGLWSAIPPKSCSLDIQSLLTGQLFDCFASPEFQNRKKRRTRVFKCLYAKDTHSGTSALSGVWWVSKRQRFLQED